jgi:hypothetical protein
MPERTEKGGGGLNFNFAATTTAFGLLVQTLESIMQEVA